MKLGGTGGNDNLSSVVNPKLSPFLKTFEAKTIYFRQKHWDLSAPIFHTEYFDFIRKKSKPSLKRRTATAICCNYHGLFRDYGLSFFFRIFLVFFFKIESWNFQYLLENKIRETSQNLFRQFLFSFFLCVVWFIWNSYEVSRNSFSNRSWKFQRSILRNKKVLFLKNMC